MSGRIRSLKPEWLEDEALIGCSDAARVASAALLLLADDHGNGRGSDRYLGAQIFPGETLAKIREALASLVAIRYVGFYEVDGQTYFAIRNWQKHQKVDKPGKPRVPKPLDDFRETLAKIPVTLAGSSRLIPIPIPTSYHDHDHEQDHQIHTGVPAKIEAAANAEVETRASLTAPSAPVSRPKKKHSPEAQAQAKAIATAYGIGYTKRYGKPPPWGAREWGQLYSLMGSWPAADLLSLVPMFFEWRNDRVIRSGHQWGKGPDCFVLKAGELQADVQAPERRKVAAIAQDRQKQEDHSATTEDQAARVAAMVIAKHANRQDPRTVREAHDAPRSLLPTNQRQGSFAVDGKALAVHRPGPGSGDRRSDYPTPDADARRFDSDYPGGDSQDEPAED